MSSKIKLLGYLAVTAIPWLLTMPAANADETFTKTSTIAVPGLGLNSFDIGFVDPTLGRYFLADRTNKTIDMVDTSNNSISQLAPGAFVGVVAGTNTSGPNGVITANNHTEVWAGDGNGSVKVIRLSTQSVTTIAIPHATHRADELCEDPQHNLVMIAHDDDADLLVTFIDTISKSVLAQLKLDGTDPNAKNIKATNGIEQCQWSPRTNKLYLAIPEVNGPGDNSKPGAVLMINPGSMKVQKVFTVDHSKCAGPQGMAIGPAREILLGCSNAGPGSVIIDELDGDLIANLPGLNGNDEVWYNPGDNQYFLAGSNHTPPILGVADPNGEEDPSAATAAGSHSVAADPVKNQVYVPGNKAATSLCGSSNGCIAVFTATGDDPGICVAEGAPVISMAGGQPGFLRTVCPPPLRHDRD